MRQGLFYSLVNKHSGQRVTWPGRPYKHFTIPKTNDILTLGMEFIVYQGRYLNFIQEIDVNAKRQHRPIDIKITEQVIETPEELPKEIEVKKPNLDELPNRTHKEAHREKQDLAYELDPIRASAGFNKLKKANKRKVFDYITQVRGLKARYDETVTKGEWISIALHGYTDKINKDKYVYNTKRLADKKKKKKVLETLYRDKGHKFDARKKVDELRTYAWEQGWLKRDPSEIMNNIVFPGEDEK